MLFPHVIRRRLAFVLLLRQVSTTPRTSLIGRHTQTAIKCRRPVDLSRVGKRISAMSIGVSCLVGTFIARQFNSIDGDVLAAASHDYYVPSRETCKICSGISNDDVLLYLTKCSDRLAYEVFVEPLSSLYETFMMTLRALRLFITFAPLLCLYPIAYFVPVTKRIWWSLLLCAIENSGPVYIKLGQWASTRRDLFPNDFCDQFARLQRSVKPHSWSVTCRRLDQSFGSTYDWRRLLSFDNENNGRKKSHGDNVQIVPIGSGCVAQVYRAHLRTDQMTSDDRQLMRSAGLIVDDVRSTVTIAPTQFKNFMKMFVEGIETVIVRLLSVVHDGHWRPIVDNYKSFQRDTTSQMLVTEDLIKQDMNLLPIAVKVLHPGIHTLFSRDLYIMKTFVDVAETLLPRLRWLNMSRCVDEFANVMKKQIDLSAEARNLDVFARNFRDISSVRFPIPVRPLVSEHVLVETFEEGEPMLQYTQPNNDSTMNGMSVCVRKQLKERIADIGIEAVFKMVFADNFVHGDLHPGNIIVQNTNIGGSTSPRLVFLDCGITASLGDFDLDNMFSVFNAVVLGNGEMVGELFLKHTREHRCNDESAFKSDMAKIVTEFQTSQKNSQGASVSTVVTELFGTLIHHRVQLEGNFALVILAMMIIEGLGHSLKPDMDVLAKARPFLLKHIEQELADLNRGPF